MPLVSGTPESILPRSDSKNPATTCKGLTSNGRPCRRSLASPRSNHQGVLAMLPHVGHTQNTAAAYFCWQHKDQASNLVDDSEQILNLQARSSIDTLVEKLGVLDIEDSKKKSRKSTKPVVRRDTLPQQWSNVQGPLMSVPEDSFGPESVTPQAPPPRVRRKDDNLHVSVFCCMKAQSEERLPPSRPRPRPRPKPSTAQSAAIPNHSSLQAVPNSLERHLSYIPATLPASMRSNLLTEIAKPLTQSDHEPGYIYIFWLTPKDVPNDAAKAASSLLIPPGRSGAPENNRRTSDVLREYNDHSMPDQPKTIMLKIGRAANVHRRMIQWSQQCGHHITLLRYYPHQGNRNSPAVTPQSSPRGSSRTTPTLSTTARDVSPTTLQKTPLVPRVERLIHLELSEQRVKRDCDGCGKEHREWFEVPATREGIRGVDAVVRRWIDWAQRQQHTDAPAYGE